MVGAVSSPVSPEIIVPVALPEGVREGNENLVKLTPAASTVVRVTVRACPKGTSTIGAGAVLVAPVLMVHV